MKKSQKKAIATEEFDKKFDNGKDMGDFLDIKKAKVNKQMETVPLKKVNPKSVLLADRLQHFVQDKLSQFPWRILFRDWTGRSYFIGEDAPHWSHQPLEVTIKTESAAKTLLSYNSLGFLDKFLEGQVDMKGNLYLLPHIRPFAKFDMKAVQMILSMLLYRTFQNVNRARVNVKSHYDIPQEALDVYLDATYLSYSCGMFENPTDLHRPKLLRRGEGEKDNFDSLEKAQWRKFKDAVDYINPDPGETLLDVGCGYGGQLIVALENHPFSKVAGWTHSSNQVRKGSAMLSKFDKSRWELNEGDYREDNHVFDHITSTGMISHVGPRGLKPYVRNIRKRIKKGGRYVHHALMTPYSRLPLDCLVGRVFNKKYVWPGYHWFTVGTHVKTLEENGFEVEKMVNLSQHYAKTTAAWYERMMNQKEVMIKNLGEPTFRAWQIFLAGVSGDFLKKGTHVYRLYCEAV